MSINQEILKCIHSWNYLWRAYYEPGISLGRENNYYYLNINNNCKNNHSYCLLSIYYVPGITLSSFNVFSFNPPPPPTNTHMADTVINATVQTKKDAKPLLKVEESDT